MPRRDELYLADMVEAGRDVVRFLGDLSHEDWMGDDLVRYAVLQRLTVIGEVARHVSGDLTGRYPDIPWRLVGDFRNIAVHNYFAVEWSLVWALARRDVHVLLDQLTALLTAEHPAVLAALDDPQPDR